MVKAGGLSDTLHRMREDKMLYRSPEALGGGYERPQEVADETIEAYLGSLIDSPQRTLDLERFIPAFDNAQTTRVEPLLKRLAIPTLVVWGTADIFFNVKWAHWLAKTIPRARVEEVAGGEMFFPEERAAEFSEKVRAHWRAAMRQT